MLVTSQFLNFKEFSEKLNSLLIHIVNLLKFDDLKTLMIYLSKNMKDVLLSQSVHLWIKDGVIF